MSAFRSAANRVSGTVHITLHPASEGLAGAVCGVRPMSPGAWGPPSGGSDPGSRCVPGNPAATRTAVVIDSLATLVHHRI